jgi:dienelactone hydrolase
MKDSLGGLLYLRGRNDIATDIIFMVTWGAAGSFQAMNKEYLAYEKMGAGFAAAIMYYPECERVDGRFAPYAPIQMFVGEKDTWNPAAACLALAKRQESGSASFDIKIYPDTYHGFDQPRPPSLRTDAAVGSVMTGGNPESAADAYKTTAAFLTRFIESGK